MELLDRATYYRALRTRDARFDGRVFVAVTSTGIYCRPVCPAPAPKLENCRFFASAAAAQATGFRPCLRCRPETAPDVASWQGTASTVSRALALIAEGGLNGENANVDALAERLGLGARQLRRLFDKHLGASPIAVAQTRRVLFAKQLIQETAMPMAEIAQAAGFGSIRRFNEVFQQLFQRSPSALRRKTAANGIASSETGVRLRLRYRAPYDWQAMLGFLQARAIAGVELVQDNAYQRSLAFAECSGTLRVAHEPGTHNLVVDVRFPNVRVLPQILARVRRVFDIGADIESIAAHLAQDPKLAPLVAQRPGLRAPGGWDGFELAVRAILGQQVTVTAARGLATQLVQLCGTLIPATAQSVPGITHVFPDAERVANADLTALGMPKARRAALQALAQAALADHELFHPFASIEQALERLRAIHGIGEWTAHYIALRALRETDAFPASDAGLLRSAELNLGARPTPAQLAERAEPWRPWRAYAAQHLWAADQHA